MPEIFKKSPESAPSGAESAPSGTGRGPTPAPPGRPKLVNRGPAGLLAKLPAGKAKDGPGKPSGIAAGRPAGAKPAPEPKAGGDAAGSRLEAGWVPSGEINRISPGLEALTVPIEGLVPDPMNAREHPDRNMEAIMRSLDSYGQVKVIVVRRKGNVVIAGNGTLEAAKRLGWTHIAANFVDFDEPKAAGFGLADNRTAELAKWNFEVVARLDKLLQESGEDSIGWSDDELEVLRMADWTPPAIAEGGDQVEEESGNELDIHFTDAQIAIINAAVLRVFQREGGMDKEANISLTRAEALKIICKEWTSAADQSESTISEE